MAESKKNRKSGIELMRCICMLMIIGYHYAQHSTSREFEVITNQFSINHLFAVALGNWGGAVGVLGFVVITSYFYDCYSVFEFKRVLNIFIKTWLYCFAFTIVGVCFNIISLKEIIQELITPIYGQYWFITAYLILMLLIPFLRKFVSFYSNNRLGKLVILLTVLIPIYDIFFPGNFGMVAFFIYIYFVMQWIKGNEKIKNYLKNKGMMLFGILILILFIISNVITIVGTELKNENLLGMVTKLNSKNIVTLLTSIAMFYGFYNLDINNSIINRLGKATFGVYILHENILMWHGDKKLLWNSFLHSENYIDTIYFPLHMLISILGIFIISSVIEMLVAPRINKMLNALYSIKKIDSVIYKANCWFNQLN